MQTPSKSYEMQKAMEQMIGPQPYSGHSPRPVSGTGIEDELDYIFAWPIAQILSVACEAIAKIANESLRDEGTD
jgi:hypothetical protein